MIVGGKVLPYLKGLLSDKDFASLDDSMAGNWNRRARRARGIYGLNRRKQGRMDVPRERA